MKISNTGGVPMKELIFQNDKYKMNWVEGSVEWGTVKVPDGIGVTVKSEQIDDIMKEEYIFTNTSDKDIFTSLGDIGIYTPFNDDYTDSQTCMTKRCHTHIWCGENISYVMALRMGGEAPHMGLVLTKGSLGGYSVERDLSKISNDRGDFILHPSPVSLAPNESFTISWTLFSHEGKIDFYNKLKKYNTDYIHINAEKYTVFADEETVIKIEPVFDFDRNDVKIKRNGTDVDFNISGGVICVNEKLSEYGEHRYSISVKGITTHCNILVLPELNELAKRRCEFIAEKQQYNNPNSGLDGAYLIYDNEEKHIYYSSESDRNGGRERVCMGLLIAKYLQNNKDEKLQKSLGKYIKYVERELFDTETGVVYNDYGRDNSWNRLYNYPWMSWLQIELYKLYSEKRYLIYAYRAIKSFYEQGGTHFYAIEIPLREIVYLLEKADMESEKNILMQYFKEHCSYIIDNGLNYPAHEVNYEQSIVAPAANLLLQMYDVTKDEQYLDGAKVQINVLELFNGLQPDYHMYEVAVRHWDGYWFGKRKMYGDTYPHYWSSVTANAYFDYAKAIDEEDYLKKADASYRGTLSMFMADGSASCAYVYPVSVNGENAGFYDPYANDQDWGLYFMLKYMENR